MTKAPEPPAIPPKVAPPPTAAQATAAAPSPEKMSTLISRQAIRRWAERAQNHLPLWLWDRIYWFAIQTKLLFSLTIILVAGAMMLYFILVTGVLAFQLANDGLNEIPLEPPELVYSFLLQMVIFLAIVMHMNQWEVEREDRTFELLIMRIPNIHRLIWFKLFVSTSWVFILTLPMFFGLAWFAGMPILSGLASLLFALMAALVVGVFTCVIASFVHHPLATGILTFVLVSIAANIMDAQAWPAPYAWAFRMFVYPPALFDDANIKDSWQLWYLLFNRSFFVFVALSIYWWLYRRLSATEKWI